MKSANVIALMLIFSYLVSVYQCLISMFKANKLLKSELSAEKISMHLEIMKFSGILLLLSQLSFLVTFNVDSSLTPWDILLDIAYSFFLFSILPSSLGIITALALIYILLRRKYKRNETLPNSSNTADNTKLKFASLSVFLKSFVVWILGLNTLSVFFPGHANYWGFTTLLFLVIENFVLVFMRKCTK